MCQRLYKIRSVSPNGAKKAFVPCGKCEECRQSLRNSWSFRLRSELEVVQKRGWKIGFFTLTYSEEMLPYLPVEFLKDNVDQPCFNRKHVRTFIDNIRKTLDSDYDVHGVKYMVCAEYGEHTRRPHYHGIISWPPSVSSSVIFALIKKNWLSYGFVFPRHELGGIDSHGYQHKPFEVSSAAAAAAYAAKYCCKDLTYLSAIHQHCKDPKDKQLRQYGTFHIQSRSLGYSYLEHLSAEQIDSLLRDGASFVGTKSRLKLPLYMRNKLLFKPRYDYVPCKSGDWWFDYQDNKWRFRRGEGTHKRFVRRDPTEYLLNNYRAVYASKVKTYESLFTRMIEKSYWTSKSVSEYEAQFFVSVLTTSLRNTSHTPLTLAQGMLSYYGVSKDKCFAVDLPTQWLSRFCRQRIISKKSRLVNDNYLKNLDYICSLVLDASKFCVTKDLKLIQKINLISDLIKSRSY